MSDATGARQRVADHLLDMLADAGLGHVFVVPGLQIDPLVKALAVHPRLRPVMACHELAAGYMADGHARATGGFGASFAIGGPGAANLVGAAITAKADRSPVLFVTGNIPAAAQGRGEFQDAGALGSNDAAAFAAALGDSLNCRRGDEFPATLQAALASLRQRRPAHLLLPMDVQLARAEGAAAAPATMPDAVGRDALAQALSGHERVLVVAGAEALDAADAVADLVRLHGLALATDSAARGLLPEDDEAALGHLGFMPHPRALAAVQGDAAIRAGQLVVVGGSAHGLARLRRWHPGLLAVSAADVAGLSRDGVPVDAAMRARRRDWLSRLAAIQRPAPCPAPGEGGPAADDRDGLSYAEVVDAVAATLPEDAACVVDAGQVRRIAVARWRCRTPRSLFVAEGMAPMGWSLGAAIGVQLARPGRRVVALLGDGAMRMHGIEIATAARYRLPILYVLFDNGAYGTVLARMQGEAEAETARLPPVDWRALAESLGVPACIADDRASLERALASDPSPEGPRLIVARVPAIEPAAPGEATGIDWGLEAMPGALDP